MAKIITTETTIKQRNGESPDIRVIRTRYIPTRRLKTKKTKKKPIDYGVTRKQFHQILDKASQPIDEQNSTGNKDSQK